MSSARCLVDLYSERDGKLLEGFEEWQFLTEMLSSSLSHFWLLTWRWDWYQDWINCERQCGSGQDGSRRGDGKVVKYYVQEESGMMPDRVFGLTPEACRWYSEMENYYYDVRNFWGCHPSRMLCAVLPLVEKGQSSSWWRKEQEFGFGRVWVYMFVRMRS